MLKVDLRSDTVTRPTPEMLAAMMAAPVGDDVFGEDPTINALQEKAAQLFGMEAALFCPSGTMTNQIAYKVLTQPMDEVILDENSHPYKYEGGGVAFNSGISVALVKGDRGRLTAAQVAERINNPMDVHLPLTRLVSLENTCNRGGGAIYDYQEILKIREVCDRNGLALHLDGARIFNALVETGESPKLYGQVFDTISVCLSKGLGAPVGSLLLGTKDRMAAAKRVRKVLGGGMRQAGFLAAAGIYALDHHVERLRADHQNARALGATVRAMSYVEDLFPVDTNVLVFRLREGIDPKGFVGYLASEGVLCVHFGGQLIRFVTHLDFRAEMIEVVEKALRGYAG